MPNLLGWRTGSSVGGKKNRGTVITVAYVGVFGFAAGVGGGQILNFSN